MQGRPDDVTEIRNLVTSRGFYGSADGFNTHMRKKLTTLLLGHILQAKAVAASSTKAIPTDSGLTNSVLLEDYNVSAVTSKQENRDKIYQSLRIRATVQV